MLTALARKEMREILPLVAVAMVAELCLAGTAMGMHLGLDLFFYQSYQAIPFVSDQATIGRRFFYVAGVMACAVGLWQTLMESSRGTFQFLLHRPFERNAIFGTKLAVGMICVLAVSATPILCYALWAATPGNHASPFQWSMTGWAWRLWAQMPLLYSGAFLSGLRPARWFGSRCLPLASAVALILVGEAFAVWIVGPVPIFAASLAAVAIYIVAILHVGRTRDFS
jgi:hypothetical protein